MTLDEKALALHEQWKGKLNTTAKLKVDSREAMSLAYTPGVAEPCRVIARGPESVYRYTSKQNTIAAVSGGSAVLGLGYIGAAASIPVMEGRTTATTEKIKLAAAGAIAGLVPDEKLSDDFILPEAFDPQVSEIASQAVKRCI